MVIVYYVATVYYEWADGGYSLAVVVLLVYLPSCLSQETAK